jgi:hypothetical protein
MIVCAESKLAQQHKAKFSALTAQLPQSRADASLTKQATSRDYCILHALAVDQATYVQNAGSSNALLREERSACTGEMLHVWQRTAQQITLCVSRIC